MFIPVRVGILCDYVFSCCSISIAIAANIFIIRRLICKIFRRAIKNVRLKCQHRLASGLNGDVGCIIKRCIKASGIKALPSVFQIKLCAGKARQCKERFAFFIKAISRVHCQLHAADIFNRHLIRDSISMHKAVFCSTQLFSSRAYPLFLHGIFRT